MTFDNGRVTAVKTSYGDVETELVVAAAGIWAPKLGALADVPIPLSPRCSTYTPLRLPFPIWPELPRRVSQPILRHQDESLYFRQVGESYGIGSYRHEPLPVEATEILDHDEAPVAPAEMPFTPSHFEKSMAVGCGTAARSQRRWTDT